MIFLRDDHNFFRAKDCSGTVHTLISRKSRMIQENILRRNALLDRIVLHDTDFVIIFAAVVTTHQYLRCTACLVKCNPLIQSIPQHRTRCISILYRCPKNDNTIHIRKCSCVLLFQQTGIHIMFNIDIDSCQPKKDQQRTRNQEHKYIPDCPHKSAFFLICFFLTHIFLPLFRRLFFY